MIFAFPLIAMLLSGFWMTVRAYYPADGEYCHKTCETTRLGVSLTEQEEGLVLKRYDDAAGYATICFGHKIEKGEKFPEVMTLDECDDLLRKDLKKKEKKTNVALRRPVKTSEFDAIMDLVFNTGTEKKEQFFSRVNKSQDPQFVLFSKARINGKYVELKGLKQRREVEDNLYHL